MNEEGTSGIIVETYTHSPLKPRTDILKIKSKVLIGKRVLSLTITKREDLVALLAEENREWVEKLVLPQFRY